jgi:ribosomal protein L32E
MVEIGYKRKCSERGLINNKIPIMINNAKDLALIGKENIGIVAKIGRKKKIEIAKEAKLKNIEIYNLNINKINKLLKQNEIKNKNIEKLNNKENKNEKSK